MQSTPDPIKPITRGLSLFTGPRANPAPKGCGVVVADGMALHWDELEPVEGQYDFSRVEKVLAYAADNGLSVFIRPYGGINAPGWLKERTRTFAYHDPIDDRAGECPYFWTPTYSEAANRMNAALAAAYDEHPLVTGVAWWAMGTVYAEPFIRAITDKATRTAMLDAGYTYEDDTQAMQATINGHAESWKRTRTSMAINPRQNPETHGSSVVEAMKMVDYAISVLGRRLVLSNNSLTNPPRSATYAKLYEELKARAKDGVGLGLQTATIAQMTKAKSNLAATLEFAVTLGASYVEPPPGWQGELLTDTQRTKYGAALKSAARPVDAANKTAWSTYQSRVLSLDKQIVGMDAQLGAMTQARDDMVVEVDRLRRQGA